MRVTEVEGAPFPVATRRIVSADAARAEARADLGAPTAVWRRGAESLTGYGVAARLLVAGPGRLLDAAVRWRALEACALVEDEVRVPGSGPIAFGAFAFADESAAESLLLVPRRVVGVRSGVAFRTDVPPIGPFEAGVRAARDAAALPSPTTGLAPAGYVRAVRRAVDRIRAGGIEKVVLARDLPVPVPHLDLAAALERLAARHGDAWVFAVDGFFGASPETLVTVQGGAMGSRVLAGTAARDPDRAADAAARAELLDSPKNRFEHALAVDSLLLSLGDSVDELAIGRPFALRLPNVWHLATDATARVRPGVGALDLVATLHPTAAVAGAPRAAALAAIRELEPFDRRRYAGPVGWIGAHGDGEWAIGLRSAEIEGADRVRAFAGAGVVGASDAEQELRETGWKLLPVLEAVQADPGLSAAAAAPPADSVPSPAR